MGRHTKKHYLHSSILKKKKKIGTMKQIFEFLPRNELQAKMSVTSPGSLMAYGHKTGDAKAGQGA